MDTTNTPRIVIISAKTITAALKLMEDGVYDQHYPMPLTELMEHLGQEQILIDEAHIAFNALYKSVLILNPRLILGLSATYTPDRALAKFYNFMFPPHCRLNTFSRDKYRRVTAYEYKCSYTKGINFKSWFTKAYSHNIFEASIMRNKHLKDNYINMILEIFSWEHVQTENSDGKCLIFFDSIKMIEEVLPILKETYPGLLISKFTGGDPLSNVLESDVTLSTIGSAGTALDIPDLKTVINTISVKSRVRNIQSFGRLRVIPGCTPNYVYLWSANIGPQQAHHQNRISLFKKDTLEYKIKEYPIDISPMW